MCLKFLGFELDSCNMEIRLPGNKLQEIQPLIGQWQLGKKLPTKKELKSLVGKLAFVCRVYSKARKNVS